MEYGAFHQLATLRMTQTITTDLWITLKVILHDYFNKTIEIQNHKFNTCLIRLINDLFMK